MSGTDILKEANDNEHAYNSRQPVLPGRLEAMYGEFDPQKGIPPRRMPYNIILLLLEGEQDLHVGADYRWLRPNDLVMVPAGMVYASTCLLNCTGYYLHFSTSFIDPLLSYTLEEEFPFLGPEAEHVINLSPSESEQVQQSFGDIITGHERFSTEKQSLLRNYIYILLLRLREVYPAHAWHLHETASHAQRITRQFRHLLQKHFLLIRKVEDYAEMMHISPRHLSELTKEATGKTPKQLITDILLLEAKVLLGTGDKTITEIAHELKFQDQSHFSHFIRQHTGNTPLKLRKETSC